MQFYLGYTKLFLQTVAPLIATLATSTLFISSSQAATRAFSLGNLEFTNFSEELVIFDGVNEGNTFVFTNGGRVEVENNSLNTFISSPVELSNNASSLLLGQAQDYIGMAQTTPRFFANFDVDKSKPFSFDFTASLDLETAVDNPDRESAIASGDISFYLLDTTGFSQESIFDLITPQKFDLKKIAPSNILALFSLTGDTNAVGDNNTFSILSSGNIKFNPTADEFLFQGSLLKTFDSNRNLTLLAFKSTKTRVTAPEPSSIIALLVFCIIIKLVIRKNLQLTK